MSEELKPCPFCGGEIAFITADSYHTDGRVNVVGNHSENCFLKDVSITFNIEHIPLTAFGKLRSWNTRASEENNDD